MDETEVPVGWLKESNCLKREFIFTDFKQAMAFINEVGKEAERLAHHPDWSNSYDKVSIVLSTHSVRGLTPKDYELAKAINKISSKF